MTKAEYVFNKYAQETSIDKFKREATEAKDKATKAYNEGTKLTGKSSDGLNEYTKLKPVESIAKMPMNLRLQKMDEAKQQYNQADDIDKGRFKSKYLALQREGGLDVER